MLTLEVVQLILHQLYYSIINLMCNFVKKLHQKKKLVKFQYAHNLYPIKEIPKLNFNIMTNVTFYINGHTYQNYNHSLDPSDLRFGIEKYTIVVHTQR